MKGIVFTEFLEMVEAKFGDPILDRIIEESDLASGGAYTAVGTYDHKELLQLVTRLSAATQTPVADLVRAFGRHLFGRFAVGYPRLFTGIDSAFLFLSKIEDYIHVEVRKLYPDAELPTFECRGSGPDRMEMIYRSSHPFGDLAEGLIAGCIEHYGEQVDIRREDVRQEKGWMSRFLLVRRAPVLQCMT